MKKLTIGLLLGVCLTLVIGATTYQQFGPVQTKAIILCIVDEFNRNRTWHRQPQITGDQVRDQIQAKIDMLQTNLVNDLDLKWITEQNSR